MNEIVFTPFKKLAKLPGVVERLVRANNGGYEWHPKKLSPRNLLAGLYVIYQNTKKENKNLKNYIESLNKRNAVLHARIAQLEVIEKQVKYEGYFAVITCYHWSCGDGCCSDSWYGYKIYNAQNVCEEAQGDAYENNYASLENVRSRIGEKYGPQIKISYDDDYSRDGDRDSEF